MYAALTEHFFRSKATQSSLPPRLKGTLNLFKSVGLLMRSSANERSLQHDKETALKSAIIFF